MMELAENNIEVPIINLFHMFKKVEENMSVLKEKWKIKIPKGTFKDEKKTISEMKKRPGGIEKD